MLNKICPDRLKKKKIDSTIGIANLLFGVFLFLLL